MNQSTSGLIALVIFAILLFFFLSAITAAPSLTTLIGNSGAGNSGAGNGGSGNSGVGTPFVLPAGTSLGSTNATPTSSAQAATNSLAPAGSTTLAGGTPYTVQSGEWLQLIADRYNTTVDAILAVNPQITDPSVLTPGQEILLPTSSTPAP